LVDRETIYLAVQQVEEGHALLADLSCDVPTSAWAESAPTSATHS